MSETEKTIRVSISDMEITTILPEVEITPEDQERVRKVLTKVEAEIWEQMFPPEPPPTASVSRCNCGRSGAVLTCFHKPTCPIYAQGMA